MMGLLLALIVSPSHVDQTKVELQSLRGAIAVFKIREDRWPRTLDELVEARLLQKVSRDAWGNAFLWLRPVDDRGHGCLLSAGEDHRPGTGDDLAEGCERTVLNQHLLVQAGLARAQDRVDAYGNQIYLVRRQNMLLAWSFGADGKPDTSDDQMARIGKK